MSCKFNEIEGAICKKITCERGFGIVNDFFVIVILLGEKMYTIEVESNLRIIEKKRVLTNFNDIYLNEKGQKMSVTMYRKQNNIEKTLLQKKIDYLNLKYKNLIIKKISLNHLGDIKIYLSRGIVLEIYNDTSLKETRLFRLMEDDIEIFEITPNNFNEYL